MPVDAYQTNPSFSITFFDKFKNTVYFAVKRKQEEKKIINYFLIGPRIMDDPKNKVFTSLFVRRPLSDHPSDHKKLLLTLPLSDVRPPTWGQSYKVGSIL